MASAARRGAEWGVVVRLPDGRQRYYSPDSGRQGQEEWSPRVSQAHRYATGDDAERVAATRTTNAQAREHLAVQLP
jgi:hypothetical protein